jgi:hypothetical protein
VKVLFLDESGDHRLKNINPTYPIFVLGGVIVERSYLRQELEPRVREFKRRFWGRDDVILHTVEMRNNAGDFAFLTDATRRRVFYDALNDMLEELEYTVVAVVIEKHEHVGRYGEHAADPYLHAFELLVEQFCVELEGDPDGGFVCAERRNPTLDRMLLEAWDAMRSRGGTTDASWRQIEDRIIGLDLRDKQAHLAGMQIADLVVTPPGRYILNTPEKADRVQWSVVERKLRRVEGRYLGAGLIVRP